MAAELSSHRLPLLLAGSGALLLFWPALAGLVRFWYEHGDYSHGFLVPLISAAVIYSHRRELGALPARSSRMGFVMLALAVAFFLAGSVTGLNTPQRLGLWASIVGSVWFVLGPAILRARPFPFAFLLLSIPLPFFILTPIRLELKGLATRLSTEILLRLGHDALSEGNVLVAGGHRLEVVDACSGIRSLMATLTLTVFIAYLVRAGWTRGTLLVLLAIPVTIFANILRILIVAVVLLQTGVDVSTGTAHDVLGILTFALSLGILYFLWRFIRWTFPPPTGRVTS